MALFSEPIWYERDEFIIMISEQWKKLQDEGKAAIKVGDLKQAALLFERSIEAAEKFGKDNWRLESAVSCAALFYDVILADYSNAESYYRRGLKILQTSHGSQSKEVANYMLSLSKVVRKQGRISEAIAIERESENMYHTTTN